MSADLIRAEALVREWHPDAELRVRRVYPRGWVATYGWPYEGGALASPGRSAPTQPLPRGGLPPNSRRPRQP